VSTRGGGGAPDSIASLCSTSNPRSGAPMHGTRGAAEAACIKGLVEVACIEGRPWMPSLPPGSIKRVKNREETRKGKAGGYPL
jgi:hypothetical protein